MREQFGADRGWDSKYWGFDAVCQVFVLLACRTTFDIFHDPASGARPEVCPVDVSDCSVSSGMTIDGAFMPYIHQFAFQPLIWGYDEMSPFDVPLEWFVWVIYVFNWVGAGPSVH